MNHLIVKIISTPSPSMRMLLVSTLVLVVLRLNGHIGWSWWLVTAPIWPVVLYWVAMIVVEERK